VPQDPDRPLVDRAAEGDRDAFADLVTRYQSRIYNLVITLGVPRGDAEDVAQEVFLRVYRGIGRFRGEALFRTWLYQVALNAVRSHATAARPHGSAVPLGGGEGDPREGAAPEPAADDPFARRLADRQLIDRALAGLPAEWREAVTLRDVEGLSYREIAELTNVPLGTVESRIFRARQQLRAALTRLLERQERP
jgi:RNA polymerase sigma-70 factor (ECF subfamily)